MAARATIATACPTASSPQTWPTAHLKELSEIHAILGKLCVLGELSPEYHARPTPKNAIEAALQYAYYYWLGVKVGDRWTPPSIVRTLYWNQNSFEQRVENFLLGNRLPSKQVQLFSKYEAMAIDLVNLLELVASVWGGSPELEKVELNLSHYLHYNNLTTADIKDKLEAQFGVGMAKQHSHSQAVPPASMGPEKTDPSLTMAHGGEKSSLVAVSVVHREKSTLKSVAKSIGKGTLRVAKGLLQHKAEALPPSLPRPKD